MKPRLIGSAVVYAALSVFCAFGGRGMSASTQEAIRPYFWLLANRIHAKYLWPCAIRTVVVSGLLLTIGLSKSLGTQVVCGAALLVTWGVFDFIVYAPGA